MGAALLINYISWSDLGGLEGDKDEGVLNLEQDQLFVMSPGIVRVWFAAMPVFIDEGSVFVQLTRRDPRESIARALIERGVNPARFAEPLIRICDDERLQMRVAAETAVNGPTSYAWRFLRGLEADLLPCHRTALSPEGGCDEQKRRVHLRDVVKKRISSRFGSGRS